MNERLKKGFYPLVLCKNFCGTTDTHLFYFPCFLNVSSTFLFTSHTHVTFSYFPSTFQGERKLHLREAKIYLYRFSLLLHFNACQVINLYSLLQLKLLHFHFVSIFHMLTLELRLNNWDLYQPSKS